MQGIVGQFFRQFGLTITAAVLISLFVAFTLGGAERAARERQPGEAKELTGRRRLTGSG
jgi:multidrug efflux pump subunit AcrB